MKKRTRLHLILSAGLLAAFAAWTLLVTLIDVKPIGPHGSCVGLATLNGAFHRLTGVHVLLYGITDWLGLVPIAVALGFALLGLAQWIGRRSLLRVDRNILLLGAFYIVVMAAYIAFEMLAVNYRPILISGCLEASYPSSTTLLTMCVMPAALMQLNVRIRGGATKTVIARTVIAFTVFMVIGRLFSGVHWLSDIVGGVLLSGGLVAAYAAIL